MVSRAATYKPPLFQRLHLTQTATSFTLPLFTLKCSRFCYNKVFLATLYSPLLFYWRFFSH